MDFLSKLASGFTIHDAVWAVGLVVVAVLVHFWPTIKAWAATRWAKVKATFQRDEAKAKAVEELVVQAVEAEVKKVADSTASEVQSLITRIETLERALALAAASATVVNNAPAAQVDTGAPTTPVQGWVAPAAPQP